MIQKRGLLTFVLIVALAGICAAQSAPLDMVYVTAAVTGAKKAPALDLKVENFQVLEEKVEQKVTFFAPPDGLWDINIILANSKLLPGRADRVSSAIRDAVDMFLKTSNPLDKIKVEELHFGSDGMFDAIDRSLVDLQKTTNPRRALIVINDDFDMPGGDAVNGLVEFSRKLNIPIYFLYTKTNSTDPTTQSTGARGDTYKNVEGEGLTNVAEQTGGAIYFVDALNQLETLCKLLAQDFRTRYVLGFKSTNDKKDDKWRKLQVKLIPPAGQKLDVAAKGKYFVPKPLSAADKK
jgi:Ca-activated chloride channel family protein